MDSSLLIEQTRQNLINYLNSLSTNLPIGVIYLIFKDIYTQIQQLYYGELNSIKIKEAQQAQQKIKEAIPKDIEITMEDQQGQDSLN